MGLGKIIFFIAVPVGGMTIAAFSLRKQLPKACRLFGNYIGLSYVYFKSIIKIMKPQDHMTYQMIDIARKTSQQSQALKRQLRNTVKRVKQQIKQKRDQTFKQFEKEFPILKDQFSGQDQRIELNNTKINGTSIQRTQTQKTRISTNAYLIEMQNKKQQLLSRRILKKQSRKFSQEL